MYNTNQREHTSFNPSTNNCLLLFDRKKKSRVEIIRYKTSKELCINKYAFYWLNHIWLIFVSFFHSHRASFIFNEQKTADLCFWWLSVERAKTKISWTANKLVDMRPRKKRASVASLHKSNDFTFALTRVENSILKSGWN